MKNGESDRFKGRGAEDERGIAKTCGRRDAREEGARFVNETFDDALARIGLLPAPPVTGAQRHIVDMEIYGNIDIQQKQDICNIVD